MTIDVLAEIIYAVFLSMMVGGAAWLVLRWMFEADWKRREYD